MAMQSRMSVESLDALHQTHHADAQSLAYSIFVADARWFYGFLMRYLDEHRGQSTWLAAWCETHVDPALVDCWQRAAKEYAALAQTGQTWAIEMLYDADDALRNAWRDVAAQERQMQDAHEHDDIEEDEELPIYSSAKDIDEIFDRGLVEEIVVCSHDDNPDVVYGVFMHYLDMHQGQSTWFYEWIATYDDEPLRATWNRAVAEYAELVRAQQTSIIHTKYTNRM
jgi:hypothetical protein